MRQGIIYMSSVHVAARLLCVAKLQANEGPVAEQFRILGGRSESLGVQLKSGCVIAGLRT